MKMRLLLIILLFASPSYSYASVEDPVVESTIRQVTVFRNGAQVTRQAEVTLSRGRNEIQFKGLSTSLNPQTIQLSGSGSFLILSLSHRQDYLDEHPQNDRLQFLISKRDSLGYLIEEKETTGNILDRELNILLSNTTLKGDQQNLSATELKQAMDYFHQKLTDLEMQKLHLIRTLGKLREEHQKFQNQISELDNSSSRNSSEITAVIQAESAGRVQLTLSYQVSNAGWFPSYDLRVVNIEDPVNLSYKANIYQTSGIDWNGVSLTVTSAIPDQGGELPQLLPWYLRFYSPQPEVRSMNEGLGRAQPSKAQELVMADRLQESPGQTVPVQEIQNQTSFSYQIELPYSVPSGGKPLTVEIRNHNIPADYRYYTVPKHRNQAYLTAKVSDWDQYNLLSGDANLFFENTYVGKSVINPRTVGDTLSFSLGRDESIVTERKKLQEFERRNFFGNKVRESYTWEISVRNSKNKPVSIRIDDQVPVTQHQDISVSLQESTDAEYNRENGMLSWLLLLKPGETKFLRFEYEIEYPRGRQVTF